MDRKLQIRASPLFVDVRATVKPMAQKI